MSGFTIMLSEWIVTLPLSPMAMLLLILLIFLVLGCLMDAYAVMLLVVPIIFPAIVALGFDPIWFGVLVVIMVETGMITPPIGMNVFVVAGMVKDVSLVTVFRGIFPFFLAGLVQIALILAFPQIALFLPSRM